MKLMMVISFGRGAVGACAAVYEAVVFWRKIRAFMWSTEQECRAGMHSTYCEFANFADEFENVEALHM
jgi:hypothetical protein